LREHGVRIPEDVAVVGYDDIRYSEFIEVPLTTVALPKYEMGQEASQILFKRIENGEKEEDIRQMYLEPKLIVRQSCGAIT
jgi:DNA-binding LacI/PurR family transcriptional regulator